MKLKCIAQLLILGLMFQGMLYASPSHARMPSVAGVSSVAGVPSVTGVSSVAWAPPLGLEEIASTAEKPVLRKTQSQAQLQTNNPPDSTRNPTPLLTTPAAIDTAFSQLLIYYQKEPQKARQELERIKDALFNLSYEQGIVRYFQVSKEVSELLSYEQTLLQELETVLADNRFSFTDTQLNTLKFSKANIYYGLLNYDKALETLDDTDEALYDSKQLGALHATRGFISQSNGDYAEALENLQTSLEYYREAGDLKNEILVLSTLAENLEINSRYDESLRYYNMALALLVPPYSETRLAYQIYSGLGILYRYREQLDESLKYHNMALNLARELQSSDFVAQTLLNLGNVYKNRQDYELALSSYRESETISRAAGIQFGVFLNYINIADVLQITDRYEESTVAYDSALVYADRFNMPLEKSRLYLGVSDIYEKMGKYKEQADYLRKYMELREELFDSEVDEAIEDLRVQYETQQKNQEIAIQKAEIDLVNAEKKAVTMFSVFGLIILIVVISTLVHRNRTLKSLYERNLELLNQTRPVQTVKNLHKDDPKGRFKELYDQITQLLEEEQLFRKDDLSLKDFSEKMGTNDKYVSQSISMYSDKTFYQLVNFYRVGETRRKMIEGGSSSQIKEIMYECGFRSRSTFNSAFKELTGMTPSQFKKMVEREG